MSERNGDQSWNPSREELAAYADGALNAAVRDHPLRQRIEEWLIDHPDAAAEVAALHRLDRLMAQTAAADPGDAAWTALWTRFQRVPVRTARTRTRWAWPAAVVLAAAAAAALLVMVGAPGKNGPLSPTLEEEEPLPVVSADDVDIIRMDGADAGVLAVGKPPVDGPLPVAETREVDVVQVNGADTDALVVGELPVQGPLVLASPGEVVLMRVDSSTENEVPDVHMGAQDVPMVWARLDEEVGK
jgi:hypothetical protein